MGAENSPGIQNFSGENLSRSFGLEEKFRRGGAIGGKQDKESRVRANVEVSRILNTSFSVGNVAETQIDAITNYDSVPHMIEIVNNAALTDRVRENAKNALYEVGLALSQNKGVFEAATKGTLEGVLASNLDGIEPYLLSSYLAKGREDEEGQRRIEGLIDVFKLKKKVDEFPTEKNKKDFQERVGGFFDSLYEERESCGLKEVEDGTEGRIVAIIGYLTGIDEGSKIPLIVETVDVDEKFVAAAEKLAAAAEKMASVTSRAEASKPDRSNSERKTNSRSGVELIKHPSLPDTEEGQLEYIEERLKIIENYKTGNVKSELSLNELTYPLFTLLTTEGNELVSKRLLDIINARLTLKDVSSAMRANNGSMGEGGRELVGTISKLGQQGYDMSPDVMRAFFGNFGDNDLGHGEEKLRTNLKTAEAWDLMEEANFDYQKFVNLIFADGGKRSEKLNKMISGSGLTLSELRVCKELLATKGTLLEGQVFNYYFEAEGGKLRAAMVKQYMIDNLMERFGIGEERAERSIRLAEEMYFASMENCVVDWDFLNGDQYAEMIHLQFIRKLDGQMNKKGKPTGPSASLNHVKTLTPGWIRSFCGVKNPAVKITSSEIMAALNAGKLTGKEQWVPHLVSVICGKVWAAKQLITSEATPLTKDVLKTSYWKGVNDYFNKVDGQIGIDGSMDGVTKTAWVAGIFQLILSNRDSEWKPDDIRLLKRILTKDIITNQESGNGKPFLTDKQWRWIEETLKVRSNIMHISFFGGLSRLFGGKR